MRIRWIVAMMAAALTLSACGAKETFETIADEHVQAAAAAHRAVHVVLPQGASAPVVQGESGKLYVCENYEMWLQTLPGGDMRKTVKAVSGFEREELTVLQQQNGTLKRYDFVWTSAGENGAEIGRAAILDDGNYHYVLTAMCSAQDAALVRGEWNAAFQSFSLG